MALLLALFLADLASLAVYYHHLGVSWPRNKHTVLKAPLGYMPMGFLQLFFNSLHGLFFPLLAAPPVAAWHWWQSGRERPQCLLWSLAWLAAMAGVSAWLG